MGFLDHYLTMTKYVTLLQVVLDKMDFSCLSLTPLVSYRNTKFYKMLNREEKVIRYQIKNQVLSRCQIKEFSRKDALNAHCSRVLQEDFPMYRIRRWIGHSCNREFPLYFFDMQSYLLNYSAPSDPYYSSPIRIYLDIKIYLDTLILAKNIMSRRE
jgi:hypothetical protein